MFRFFIIYKIDFCQNIYLWKPHKRSSIYSYISGNIFLQVHCFNFLNFIDNSYSSFTLFDHASKFNERKA